MTAHALTPITTPRFDCPRWLLRSSPTDPRGGNHGDLSDLDVGQPGPDGKPIPVLKAIWVRTIRGVVPRTFEIIDGHRRTAAAERAGLATVPIEVHDELSDDEVRLIQLREFSQRKDLTIVQRALAVRDLQRAAKISDTEIAARLHLDKRTVQRHLAIAELGPEAHAALDAGRMSLGVAMELTTIRDPERQAEAVAYVAGADGQPMEARHALAYIRRTFQRYLVDAGFTPGMAYGASPSCDRCPNNTAVQRSLFEEVDDGDDARCTDQPCWEAKTHAAAAELAARVRAAGGRVLDGEEGAGLYSFEGTYYTGVTAGVVVLDDRCARDDQDRPYRQLVGDALPSTLIIDRQGRAHGLMTVDEAHAAMRAAGHGDLLEPPPPKKKPIAKESSGKGAPQPAAPAPAPCTPPAHRRNLEAEIEEAAVELIFAEIRQNAAALKVDTKSMRFLAALTVRNADTLDLSPAAVALGIAERDQGGDHHAALLKWIEQSSPSEIIECLALVLCCPEVESGLERAAFREERNALGLACRFLKIDGPKLMDYAAAEVEKKAADEAAAKKPQPAPAKPTAAKGTPKPAKAKGPFTVPVLRAHVIGALRAGPAASAEIEARIGSAIGALPASARPLLSQAILDARVRGDIVARPDGGYALPPAKAAKKGGRR